MGFEPTTFSLARRRSTTEPHPLIVKGATNARVELRGIEPLASSMPLKRSPS